MSMTAALARVSKQYTDRTEASFEMTLSATQSRDGGTVTLEWDMDTKVEIDWDDGSDVETVVGSSAQHNYALGQFNPVITVVGVPSLTWTELVDVGF